MPSIGLLLTACIGTASPNERLLQQVQAISATQSQASVLVRVGGRTLFERYAPGNASRSACFPGRAGGS